MQYFGSNIVEGVAESWVETEMSWVEVYISWVEVDGAGWRWVHGLVIIPFGKTFIYILNFWRIQFEHFSLVFLKVTSNL